MQAESTREFITEAVEVCPHCDSENVYINWDVETQGYIAICQHCGRKIFLCDECLHADDNPERKCDWNGVYNPKIKDYTESVCFRGNINEIKDGYVKVFSDRKEN